MKLGFDSEIIVYDHRGDLRASVILKKVFTSKRFIHKFHVSSDP